ncbi:MAG: hypothetical protein H6739_30975 [Alphaproteobacteria bacterium]|nr:hypothetical protein [Alphaproteobacteria bacterium]
MSTQPSAPDRSVPWGVLGVVAALIVAVGVSLWPQAAAPPPEPPPEPPPPPAAVEPALPERAEGLVVVLLDDAAAPRGPDRSEGLAAVLDAIGASAPRATLLGVEVRPADVDRLRVKGGAIYAVGGRGLAVCGGEAAGCVDGLVRVDGPSGAIERWPVCLSDIPTLPWAAAHPAGGCPARVLSVPTPPPDPCALPYRRLYASELLSGEPLARDPLTFRKRETCGVWPIPLEGATVLLGDPRPAEGERTLLRLGAKGRPVPEIEGLAFIAALAWGEETP